MKNVIENIIASFVMVVFWALLIVSISIIPIAIADATNGLFGVLSFIVILSIWVGIIITITENK